MISWLDLAAPLSFTMDLSDDHWTTDYLDYFHWTCPDHYSTVSLHPLSIRSLSLPALLLSFASGSPALAEQPVLDVPIKWEHVHAEVSSRTSCKTCCTIETLARKQHRKASKSAD